MTGPHPSDTVVLGAIFFIPGLMALGAVLGGMACFFSWVGERMEDRSDRKNEQLAHRRQMELETLRANIEQAATLCGCKHDIAFHNRDTGICHHEKSPPGRLSLVRCTCQRYTGKRPSLEDCLTEIIEMEN